jgi:predicted nucleic acid-binding protein
LITTNYILAELVSLLISSLRLAHPRIVAFIEGLTTSPDVDVVHVDPILDAQAWQWFTERPDKEWGLVDCAGFVVIDMHKR